jgi:hypothetical protein
MKLPHLSASIHSALFNEEPKAPVEDTTPVLGAASARVLSMPTPVPTADGQVQASIGLDFPTTSATGENKFIAILHKATDFDTSDVGKLVKKYADSLDGLPLSEEAKFTTVLKLGIGDGLTAEKVISAIQKSLSDLEGQVPAFDLGVTKASTDKIASIQQQIQARADTIKSLEDQITAARGEQSTFSANLINAQTDLQRLQAQFKSAYDSRKQELSALLSHYASMKG